MAFLKACRVSSTIMLLAFLGDSINGRIYNNCELAHALEGQGLDGEELGKWVCIASHESSLDSDAIGRLNDDGSLDHGLWQISDKYWVGRDSPGGACGFSADQVRGENLANAVKCVRIILEEHQRLEGDGWMAWAVYSSQGHCRDDAKSYVAECF